jgi:hypothetical protein
MGAGLDWAAAAAGVYQELGRPVDCAAAWGAYMPLRGGRDDEHCIVSLKVRCRPARASPAACMRAHQMVTQQEGMCLPVCTQYELACVCAT